VSESRLPKSLKIQHREWSLNKLYKATKGFTRRRSGLRVPARPPFVISGVPDPLPLK
jgi:hypothetical protein